MSIEQSINDIIKATNADTNQISDGYHTFGELYEHRIVLFIQYCKMTQEIKGLAAYGDIVSEVWKSALHSDGSCFDGWFVLGVGKAQGEQITYHLPMKYWDACSFAETLNRAPEFDGHTSNDVLKRLLGFSPQELKASA